MKEQLVLIHQFPFHANAKSVFSHFP